MIQNTIQVELRISPNGEDFEAVAKDGLPALVEVVAFSEESFEIALENLKLALWSFGIDTPIEVEYA